MDVLRGVPRRRIHRDNTAKTKAAIVSLQSSQDIAQLYWLTTITAEKSVFSLKLVGPSNYRSSETNNLDEK